MTTGNMPRDAAAATRVVEQLLQDSTQPPGSLTAQDVVRLAADTRKAWIHAMAAQQSVVYLQDVKEAAEAGAELARRMTRIGNWSRLQQAREQVYLADAVTQLARSQGALAATPEPTTMAHAKTVPPLAPPNGRPYNPVVTLNGWTCTWRMRNGVKEFHLVDEPVLREIASGMTATLWGYNGQRLPNGMDGVGGLTQPQIPAGKTWVYEFVARRPGTFMYHPHADEMTPMAMGMMGKWITHPKAKQPFEPLKQREHIMTLPQIITTLGIALAFHSIGAQSAFHDDGVRRVRRQAVEPSQGWRSRALHSPKSQRGVCHHQPGDFCKHQGKRPLKRRREFSHAPYRMGCGVRRIWIDPVSGERWGCGCGLRCGGS